MRKACLATALLLFTALLSFSQTTVTIIGTKHDGNRYFDDRTLYKYLKDIGPDVILIEQDDEFKKVTALRLAKEAGFNIAIEDLAVQKYKNKNKDCIIKPYDTTFDRKQYLNNLNSNYKAINKSLRQAFRSHQMNSTDSLEYVRYNDLSNFIYSTVLNSGLEDMNSDEVLDSCRAMYHLDRSSHKQSILQYVSDTSLSNWYLNELVFWDNRNSNMATRILHHITQYPGKNIVVFCGLLHKYYLLDALSPYQKKYGFQIASFP
jgi:hypothetical protein